MRSVGYFDFASIMTYDFVQGARRPGKFVLSKRHAANYQEVLRWRRNDGVEFWLDDAFYAGGMQLPHKKSISSIDVIRIAQLYPGTLEQQQALGAHKPGDMWKPIHTSEMIDSRGGQAGPISHRTVKKPRKFREEGKARFFDYPPIPETREDKRRGADY
ncbi:hypothetical protein LTR78_000350 [Recurvomyces mirabilis]|uniref:Uncharacterized protein n=1 Tax=Recurvomyces mirabilis TaxID=574656 RepID=A0AAE0WXV0_9PEZI|nr:hypothetical protein LTR78_000350 [Recurvomyces mirabilis]KAK5162005.1 hypothetical protein LTS14_000351 [Recurvomyces mirabilis]